MYIDNFGEQSQEDSKTNSADNKIYSVIAIPLKNIKINFNGLPSMLQWSFIQHGFYLNG